MTSAMADGGDGFVFAVGGWGVAGLSTTRVDGHAAGCDGHGELGVGKEGGEGVYYGGYIGRVLAMEWGWHAGAERMETEADELDCQFERDRISMMLVPSTNQATSLHVHLNLPQHATYPLT